MNPVNPVAALRTPGFVARGEQQRVVPAVQLWQHILGGTTENYLPPVIRAWALPIRPAALRVLASTGEQQEIGQASDIHEDRTAGERLNHDKHASGLKVGGAFYITRHRDAPGAG